MIRVQRNWNAAEPFLDKIDAFCKKTFNDSDFKYHEEMVFAIHEAIINAIEATRHFRCEKKKVISLDIEINQSYAQAKVSNHIQGKLHLEALLREKDIDRDLWEDRGRGLFFIRELVDELWQETDNTGRFILGMRKFH